MNRCGCPNDPQGSNCQGNAKGSMSGAGWTKASLYDFLGFLDDNKVTRVDLWTGNALINVQSVAICDWFIDELRAWRNR